MAGAEPAAVFDREILPLLDAAYSFARYLARDADGAHDIVQEAFLRAYRAHDAFQGQNARAWLFSIVRNCYRDWQLAKGRRLRHEVQTEETGTGGDNDLTPEIPSEEDTPEAALIRRSEAEQVQAVLADLPAPLREVLVLRELEGLSYREIADVTELPIGTVMSRLSRARAAFGIAWQKLASECSK